MREVRWSRQLLTNDEEKSAMESVIGWGGLLWKLLDGLELLILVFYNKSC